MVRTSFFVCLSQQAAVRQLQAPQPDGYLTLCIYKQSTNFVGVFVSISDVAGYRLNFCILYKCMFPMSKRLQCINLPLKTVSSSPSLRLSLEALDCLTADILLVLPAQQLVALRKRPHTLRPFCTR